MADYTKPPSPIPSQSPPAETSSLANPAGQTATRSSSTEVIPDSNPFGDSAVSEELRPARAVSPSAPPVNVATRPPPAQHSPAVQQNAPADPRIAALRSMFPDYDDLILQSVLESAGGNQDTAIEILLGMSDPNYKSDAPTSEPIILSQTELDEQLARRLMIEEQEQQQQQWLQQHPQPQRRNSRPFQAQPSAQVPGSATGERDTMTDFQEQFTKVAEAGKKTFGSIFTKVKAKIQEFEQGRPGQSSGETSQPSWGGAHDPNYYPQQTAYAPYQHAPSHPQPQASYYDPNPSTPASTHTSPPTQTLAPAIQGYDVTPNVTPPATSSTNIAVPASTSPLSSAVSPPPPTGTGSGIPSIDGGKLGLLPKRPVSLVRDPPSGGQQGQQKSARKSLDSDDGLEYAENPFEDHRK